MSNIFSLKSITDLHSQAGIMERSNDKMKSHIWICPDCGKLYLSLLSRRRQGSVCGCGHLFDERDIG